MRSRVFLSVLAVSIVAILFSGCSNTPSPSPGKEKPTVFIQSISEEKFKNLTEEMAIWKGISPHYVKDKTYLQCDLTPEVVGLFARQGFDIVYDIKDADYKTEVEVESCGGGVYNSENTPENIREKLLYRHFSKWVNNTDKSKLPSDAKEILYLIEKNDPEGFKRFHDEMYIQKYGSEFGTFLANWKNYDEWSKNVLVRNHGMVFPARFRDIDDDEKKVLEDFYKKSIDVKKDVTSGDHFAGGADMVGGGAGMVGNYGSGSPGGNVGGAFMALGILMAFSSEIEAGTKNKLTITNLKTNKKLSLPMSQRHDSWNSKMVDYKRYVFSEISWSDLK